MPHEQLSLALDTVVTPAAGDEPSVERASFLDNIPEPRLPAPKSAAHTRHYMPVVEGRKETRTKIFDTFVHVNDSEAIWIRWAVDLSINERELLTRLLASFSYLGRAESLVEATFVEPTDESLHAAASTSEWTRPAEASSLADGEPIRLLAPQAPDIYVAWAAAQSDPASKGKKTRGKKKAAAIPASLHDALQLDTADWKKDGWSLPPGARWLDYPPARLFQNCPDRASPLHPQTVASHRRPLRNRRKSSAEHHPIAQPR